MLRDISYQQFENYFFANYSLFGIGKDRITNKKYKLILEDEYNIIKKKILLNTYKFTSFRELIIPMNSRKVYIPTIRDKIVLDILHDNIKNVYSINYSNRDNAIAFIRELLSSKMDFFIIRLDIKECFKSLSYSRIINKLNEDSLISVDELYLVKEFLKNNDFTLSPGIGLSNVLAEIYLIELDKQLKEISSSVRFYNRYVDDIILVLNGECSQKKQQEMLSDIENIFKKMKIELNNSSEKFSMINWCKKSNNNLYFDYLGYRFLRINNKLDIDISPSKKTKIYNKIDFCFRDYKRNNNEELLLERIRFLTNKNVILKEIKYIKDSEIKKTNKMIYFGILENYKYISLKSWEKIDKYIYQRTKQIKYQLSREGRRALYSISLVSYNSNEIKKTNRMYKLTNRNYVDKLSKMGVPERYYRNKKRKDLIEYYLHILNIT